MRHLLPKVEIALMYCCFRVVEVDVAIAVVDSNAIELAEKTIIHYGDVLLLVRCEVDSLRKEEFTSNALRNDNFRSELIDCLIHLNYQLNE